VSPRYVLEPAAGFDLIQQVLPLILQVVQLQLLPVHVRLGLGRVGAAPPGARCGRAVVAAELYQERRAAIHKFGDRGRRRSGVDAVRGCWSMGWTAPHRLR